MFSSPRPGLIINHPLPNLNSGRSHKKIFLLHHQAPIFSLKKSFRAKNIYQQAKIFSLKIEFQSKKIFLLHLYYTIKHQYFLWRASEQENIPLTPSSTDIFFEKELQSYHKWFLIWIVNKSAEKTLYWIW